MRKLQKSEASKRMNSSNATGMSVCNSCAACGCGGSRCVSTCKGCHDKDVALKTAKEVYTEK